MMPMAVQASAPPARETPAERRMPEVRKPRHCRHCLAEGCRGNCLLSDGTCIHGWNGKRPAAVTWRAVLTRNWWHQVLWGRP
jgi:hypothetical protein